jgi:signal transduction histidine kinase
LNKSKQLIAFRIVQEFVNNSIKHSDARNIAIVVSWNNDLKISLSDDGNGFDIKQIGVTKSGIGLFTMQNRARMLDTELKIETSPQRGTRATLNIPLT